jgi:pimeloyl-ACP methyl ester carboxylesterase
MGIDQRDKFAAMACRSAVILGEDSADEGAFFADHMAEITAGKLPIFKIPGTHHHLMFDDPVAVAVALKAVLLTWIAEDGAEEMRTALERTLRESPVRRN